MDKCLSLVERAFLLLICRVWTFPFSYLLIREWHGTLDIYTSPVQEHFKFPRLHPCVWSLLVLSMYYQLHLKARKLNATILSLAVFCSLPLPHLKQFWLLFLLLWCVCENPVMTNVFDWCVKKFFFPCLFTLCMHLEHDRTFRAPGHSVISPQFLCTIGLTRIMLERYHYVMA